MGPPQAIPILGQMEDTPVQVSYLWIPGGCPKSCRPDFNQEVTQIVAPYWPPSVYLSSTQIMTPLQAIPILCQIEYTSVHVLIPVVSWWVPYLSKGYRPDFNNGLGGDSNSGPVLPPPAFI